MGIYIHIPFCKQACRYCDFFFSVSLHYMDEYLERLIQEINMRGSEHGGATLESLYFGGGTPSLLTHSQLDRVLEAIQMAFTFSKNAEITIECNPDDLHAEFLKRLASLGFNRLSIGVQSFHEKELQLMRRSHNADQAAESILRAAASGFSNISMDLIYGIPGQLPTGWEQNLNKAISLPISHLSAYHLTFEPGTVFDHWKKKGRLVPVHEEESIQFYRVLREIMISAGYDHYEISNFSLPGKTSQHNLLYWSGLPYLGMGPSAHSFDGQSRRWNIASLKRYMETIARGIIPTETENLSEKDRYHDYLITSLRTKWGADPEYIALHFGDQVHHHFRLKSRPFLQEGHLWVNQGKVAIHPDHWLITDHILRELFLDL